MLYVYAITRAGQALPTDVSGLNGMPLQAQASEHIAAIYSTHPDRPAPTPTAENVLCHERVIEALMRDGPVLPVRFGTAFSTAAKIDAVLLRGERAFSDGLERVEGCVELGVHAVRPRAAETAPAETGREYMLKRLASERARREAQDQLHAALEPLAVDSVRRSLSASSHLLFSAAYLVRGQSVAAFRQRVLELGPARPDLRLLCTGPWPPYHFAPVIPAAPEATHVGQP